MAVYELFSTLQHQKYLECSDLLIFLTEDYAVYTCLLEIIREITKSFQKKSECPCNADVCDGKAENELKIIKLKLKGV